MRRLIRLSICLSLLICLMPAASANAGEFRAFWADAWGLGFKTSEQTTKLVEFAARYRFTDIFVQVRKRADAYYDSAIEPKGVEVAEDYDPLADIIEKAHRRGIRVHAWIMLCDAWTDSPWLQLDPRHVYARHPEWISQDDKGGKAYTNGRMYLDPALPEVREYLAGIVLDIARRYPVDGIQLDGLRYPESNFGYNPRSVALFNAEYKRDGIPAAKDPDWCDWRRERISALARDLPAGIRKVRPSAKVSLAAYWNHREARDRFYQDWPAWARAGYFDFIVPMVFVPKDVKDFIRMVDDVLSCGNGSETYVGQGTWRFPLETTNRHLRVIRGKGARGFVLFDYTALSTPGPDGKCLADGLRLCP